MSQAERDRMLEARRISDTEGFAAAAFFLKGPSKRRPK